MNLSTGDQAEYVDGSQVSTGTFGLLGVRPALGRSFVAEDGTPGRENVVILSDALWRRQFAADPLVVGQKLWMNDVPATVVGVMPRGFEFPYQAKFWTPRVFHPTESRGNNWVNAVVRLGEGVTVAQADAHLHVVNRQIQEQYPKSNAGVRASLGPLRRLLLGGNPDEVRGTFLLMLGAVGFVLLIACANLANLLLTRDTSRGREIAVRAALGASRRRLVRQLLTESGLLGAVGGACGVLVAAWALALFPAVAATRFEIPYWVVLTIDGRAALFTAVVSLATGLAVGAAPAFRVTQSDVRGSLQESARGAGGGTRAKRLRNTFVIAEVALAMVLLVGAGLLIRTVMRLGRVDPEFDAAHSFTARVFLGGGRYDSTRVRGAFFNELTRRIEALPGVAAVGATNLLPLGTTNWEGVQVEAYDDSARTTMVSSVAGRYFRALAIRLREGREFTELEGERGGPVVIINETMARRYWSAESPLGRRVRFGQDPAAPWHTVVGVSQDVKQGNLEGTTRDQVYVPYAQRYSWRNMSVIVRAPGDPMRSVSIVRAELARIDPIVALYDVQPMQAVVRRSFREKALYSDMFAVFAGVGLGLAAIGIYGVMAYSVAQRTHEIGVRIALGAERGHVLGLVVQHGLALASAGVVIGILAALALTRVLGSLLFGVSPLDLATFAVTALLLAGVAVVASYVPARRAARVDPMVALRME
jgi:putative ABC transport system permease protein